MSEEKSIISHSGFWGWKKQKKIVVGQTPVKNIDTGKDFRLKEAIKEKYKNPEPPGLFGIRSIAYAIITLGMVLAVGFTMIYVITKAPGIDNQTASAALSIQGNVTDSFAHFFQVTSVIFPILAILVIVIIIFTLFRIFSFGQEELGLI